MKKHPHHHFPYACVPFLIDQPLCVHGGAYGWRCFFIDHTDHTDGAKPPTREQAPC